MECCFAVCGCWLFLNLAAVASSIHRIADAVEAPKQIRMDATSTDTTSSFLDV